MFRNIRCGKHTVKVYISPTAPPPSAPQPRSLWMMRASQRNCASGRTRVQIDGRGSSIGWNYWTRSLRLSHSRSMDKREFNVRGILAGQAPKDLAQLSQLAEKSELDQGLDCQGLHYIAVVGECARFPGAVMRGGGCGGKSRLSCWTRSFWSAFNSVYRLMIRVRPSAVGKCTSSICTAASLSS